MPVASRPCSEGRASLRPRVDDRVSGALGFATPAALRASFASGVTGSASAVASRVVDAAENAGTSAAATADRVVREPLAAV